MKSKTTPRSADATDARTASCTVDAFHRGAFFLAQPAKGGHRAGLDAMVLAASVPASFSGRLADLGAGAGAAGLAVASRCGRAKVVLVERSSEMVDFARMSLDLPGNAGLQDRASVLEADVTLAGKDRVSAGLVDASFDFVIFNPPFNEPADRASPDGLKRQAHVMDGGLFEAWLRTAAAILRPRGRVALIARPASLAPILEALDKRFGGVEIIPILPRAVESAIRIVVRAVRGSKAGLSIRPPLVLHGDQGTGFTPHAETIINGQASLFGD